jgi:hypothetical protein
VSLPLAVPNTRSKLFAKESRCRDSFHDVVRLLTPFASQVNSQPQIRSLNSRAHTRCASGPSWTTITTLPCRPSREMIRKRPQTRQQTQAQICLRTPTAKHSTPLQKHRFHHHRLRKLLGRRPGYCIMALCRILQRHHPHVASLRLAL